MVLPRWESLENYALNAMDVAKLRLQVGHPVALTCLICERLAGAGEAIIALPCNHGFCPRCFEAFLRKRWAALAANSVPEREKEQIPCPSCGMGLARHDVHTLTGQELESLCRRAKLMEATPVLLPPGSLSASAAPPSAPVFGGAAGGAVASARMAGSEEPAPVLTRLMTAPDDWLANSNEVVARTTEDVWSPLSTPTAVAAPTIGALAPKPSSVTVPVESAADEAQLAALAQQRAGPRCFPSTTQDMSPRQGLAMVGTAASGPVPNFGAAEPAGQAPSFGVVDPAGAAALGNAHHAFEALKGAFGRASAVALELGATPVASSTAFPSSAPSLDISPEVPRAPAAPTAPAAPAAPAPPSPGLAEPALVASPPPGPAVAAAPAVAVGLGARGGHWSGQQHAQMPWSAGSSLNIVAGPPTAIGSVTAPTPATLGPSLQAHHPSSVAAPQPAPPAPLRPEAPWGPGGMHGTSTPAGAVPRAQHMQMLARVGSQTQRSLHGPAGMSMQQQRSPVML